MLYGFRDTPKRGGSGFLGFTKNKKDSASVNYSITNYFEISNTNPVAFSYGPMPSTQTILSLIAPWISFSNTGQLDSRYMISFTNSPIALSGFFTNYNRVRIIDGDGSADSTDWVVFNFGQANDSGDWSVATGTPHFGGETSSSAFNSFSSGKIWGYNASTGWKLLIDIGPSGSASFSRADSTWFTAGNTVTSGVGKRTEYDSLPITHLGFSVTI